MSNIRSQNLQFHLGEKQKIKVLKVWKVTHRIIKRTTISCTFRGFNQFPYDFPWIQTFCTTLQMTFFSKGFSLNFDLSYDINSLEIVENVTV